MPAGSDRKWEQWPSKETSLWAIPKPGTEQTCLCTCRQVDVMCQGQQLSFFSEQYFLLTFLSFSREFLVLFEKHSSEINVFTLHYIFGFKHFTMGELVKSS